MTCALNRKCGWYDPIHGNCKNATRRIKLAQISRRFSKISVIGDSYSAGDDDDSQCLWTEVLCVSGLTSTVVYD